MNEQMITWMIIVAIFAIALLFRISERIHERPVKDKKMLDTENKNLYIMEEDFDEFDDL